MSTLVDYTDDELWSAAIALSRTKPKRSSKELSRKTDKSYILVAHDGEIIARLKLSDVLRRCHSSQHASAEHSSSHRTNHLLAKVDLKIWLGLAVSTFLFGLFKIGAYFLYEQKLSEELASNKQSLVEIEKAAGDFIRFQEIAGSTARIALSTPVTKLQELQRTTERIRVGPCLVDPLKRVSNGQTEVIDGFISFMDSDNSEYLAAEKISIGTSQIGNGLAQARKCSSMNFLRQQVKT